MKPWEMRRLVRACTLGAPHKMTLLVLCTYADASLTCFPGRPALCADTGLSDRRLREVLAELAEAGFVRWSNRGEKTVYTLCQIGEFSPEIPSSTGENSPICDRASGENSPKVGENSPVIGEISPILLYIGEDTLKRPMKVLSPSPASSSGAVLDPKVSELEDPITSWVNRTVQESFRFWPALESLTELRAVWATWLRHVVALTSRRPSFVTVDLHLKTVRQAFEAAGEAHAVECLTWSMTHSKPLPVVKPARSHNVVPFSPAEKVDELSATRDLWLRTIRGMTDATASPLAYFAERFPAHASRVPAEWVTEAERFLAEAKTY